MGGRGASASIPSATPTGGGGGSNDPMDEMPGNPATLAEALGPKGRAMSDYNAVMHANPFYDGTRREYSENCQRAVVATEARFRGYDVIASPTYTGDAAVHGDNWSGYFEGAHVDVVGHVTRSGAEHAFDRQMAQYGPNARVVMSFGWKDSKQGHVINIVRRGGQMRFYDGQVGVQYSRTDLFRSIRPETIRLVRVDNLSFSDAAREAVRQNPNRKK